MGSSPLPRNPSLSVAGLLRLARAHPAALLETICIGCARPYAETVLAAKLHPRCPFCGLSESFQRRAVADPSVLP